MAYVLQRQDARGGDDRDLGRDATLCILAARELERAATAPESDLVAGAATAWITRLVVEQLERETEEREARDEEDLDARLIV